MGKFEEEMAHALSAMNQRLLKVEGETFALRHLVGNILIVLDTAGVVDREIFDLAVDSILKSLANVDPADAPTEAMFNAAKELLVEMKASRPSDVGFSVINGGKED